MSALEELREQAPDLGTGLPKEPAPKFHWMHVWGRWSWDARTTEGGDPRGNRKTLRRDVTLA